MLFKEKNTKEIGAIHKHLIEWYKKNRRPLPWRASLDPYRIWISEIMLQQTRVEAVIPYYEKFLESFPSVAALAAADIDDVLKHWAGLGYYSRARNLKKAAEKIQQDHRGVFPKSCAELLTLPGIGPYTSAAIASIAFQELVPAIDGNLERVLSRILALKQDPKTQGRDPIFTIGTQLALLGSAGDLNQALMDLASSICLPKNPNCLICPISKFCEARKTPIPQSFPLKKTKQVKKKISATGVVLFYKDQILLAKRKKGSWLAGMWDIPWWCDQSENEPSSISKSSTFSMSSVKRVITNHKISFQVYGIKTTKNISKEMLPMISLENELTEWFQISELGRFRFPNSSQKALDHILSIYEDQKP